ncbi:LOW QUALITY PROTEIN: AF4/FMR2 family member 1-like [Menidia menidia]
MASHPSVSNEERNLLRLRAREQRNQETSQSQELNPENVPLFGEPYKTHKGDELSTRIQRMLGSYEDVNYPCSHAMEALAIPACVSFPQSDPGQPLADKSAPFSGQSQKGQLNSSHHHGHPSTQTQTPLSIHSAHKQKKSDVLSHLRQHAGLPQSPPDANPPPPPHSTDHDTDMDAMVAFDGHQLQMPADGSPGPAEATGVSTLRARQSPPDASLPVAMTFPSLLLSKQPGTGVTQKPTAYVRPINGQDQVVHESPELKPVSEHYGPLPEFPNKSDLDENKTIPQYCETTAEEVQCVEDILREMTHSWPPVLTPVHTPGSDRPAGSPLPAKVREQRITIQEAARVPSCPEHKDHASPLSDPSHFSRQISPISCEAHSSCVETTSSSDSESSPESESDSEGTTEDPPRPPEGSSVKAEPDASAVSHGDWQLARWIRSAQQNSLPDGRGGALVQGGPSPKQQATPSRGSRLPPDEPQPEEPPADLDQFSRSVRDEQKKPVCVSRKLPEQTAAGCPDPSQEGPAGQRGGGESTQTADRPKVKTKTGQGRKDGSSGSKRDAKRTKRAKAQAQAPPHHPDPCSCPPKSPAQPDPVCPPPLPADSRCSISSSSKPKAEAVRQSATKTPQKSAPRPPEAAKGRSDLHRPPGSLLVKISLSLISRVPQSSSGRNREAASGEKRPTLVQKQEERASEAPKAHKRKAPGKKPPNVEVENKLHPKKRQRLEDKSSSSAKALIKAEGSSNPAVVGKQKKAKKHAQDADKSKDSAKDSKVERCGLGKVKAAVQSKESHKGKKSSGKTSRHQKTQEKPPKSRSGARSTAPPLREAATSRPLLTFDERQHPVRHYIREAKRLKHKADAEPDKLSKAFNYLEAAMFFVESGIAMERDPQISGSSFTMYADTVELIKFILKLKNPGDSVAPPSEKDMLALCLRCQSLLQMAMFRHKHKLALKYSKTLADHFSVSLKGFPARPAAPSEPDAQVELLFHHPPHGQTKAPENPPPPQRAVPGRCRPPPAAPRRRPPPGATVSIPLEIQQVALTYVSVTSLFVSAQDLWEQAEGLALKGTGVLAELDGAVGPLGLTSSMSFLVRYVRQGVHWLRLDCPKV